MPPTKTPRTTRSKTNAPEAEASADPDPAYMPDVNVLTQAKLPLRPPNPGRKKRVQDPAAPDMPRKIRTPEEMAAAREKEALITQRIAELEAQKYETLAEMELDQDDEDEAEEAKHINTIADVQKMSTVEFGAIAAALRDPVTDALLDEYVMNCTDLDLDYEEIVARKKKEDALLKKKKPATAPKATKKKKGEVRAAVDNVREKLVKDKKRRSEGEGKSGNPKKLKTLLPSGLIDGWRDHVPAATPDKSKNSGRKSDVAPPTFPLGGLDDEDVSSTRPLVARKGKGAVKPVVEIVSDSDSDGESMEIRTIKAQKMLDAVFGVGKAKIDIGSKNVSTPRVKVEGVVQTSAKRSAAPVIAAAVPVAMSGNLPAFVKARWAVHFLPTLYFRLGNLKDLWDLPGGDVAFLQEILDHVYPGNTYKIALGCPVYVKGKDRINDKRSFFGRRAATVVDAFFATQKFLGKPHKIAKYAKHAIEADGPGIWEVPAPAGLSPGDALFSAPDGVFASDHCIAVFAPFVKSTVGSIEDFGNLYGGLAMTAIGIECAFLRYVTGAKVPHTTPFSRENVAELAAQYVKSVGSLTPRRWKIIMRKCAAANKAELAVMPSAPTMAANRSALFLPSSPAASFDDEVSLTGSEDVDSSDL